MICENIKNKKNYASINHHFIAAFKFLEQTDLKGLAIGKYEIDGENLFVLVQEYMTESSTQRRWEAHERYADIQYIVDGKELIGYYPVEGLELLEDKLQERDIAFYKNIESYSKLELCAGDYAIFFPGEAHKPCCTISERLPVRVKKVVVKIFIK